MSATGKSIQLRCQSIFCLKTTPGGCVCVSVCVCVRALGGEESRKGQASEGPELGLIYFMHSVEIQSVCVCVCACVCAEGGRNGQASEGTELGLTHFTHRVEIQSGIWGWQQTPGLSRPTPPPQAAARAACSCVRNTAAPASPAKPVQSSHVHGGRHSTPSHQSSEPCRLPKHRHSVRSEGQRTGSGTEAGGNTAQKASGPKCPHASSLWALVPGGQGPVTRPRTAIPLPYLSPKHPPLFCTLM